MAKKAPEAFVYNAILERIVDGDTFDCCLDLGFDVKLHKQRVRLAGIDTPESRTRNLEEKALGLKAVFWAYVFPFILMFSTLIIASNFLKEWLAGLISLLIIVPYYIVLYFLKNALKSAFQVSILKI